MTDTTLPAAAPHPVDRVLGAVVDAAGLVAAWSGLALVLVVGGNVLMRYAFNSGSVAMQELEWHLISPIALLGMAYGMRHGGQVRVDVAYDRMGPRAQAAVDLASALLMVAVGAAVVALALPYVGQSWAMGEGSPDPGGLPARWLLKAFIPVGFALLVVQAAAQALLSLRILVPAARRPDPASRPG